MELAAGLVDPANPNVLSDVGVAAATARAALGGSDVNITVNAALLRDADAARGLLDEVGRAGAGHGPADEVAARVVERLKASTRLLEGKLSAAAIRDDTAAAAQRLRDGRRRPEPGARAGDG